MSDINLVALSGRLTRDPELRHTAGGTPVANTAIAVERYKKDEDNDVSFIDLVIFGGFGELVATKARKGDSVSLDGRLNQSRWETEDGSKRSRVEVIVNTMVGEFVFRKADGSDTPDREGGDQQAMETTSAAAGAADDDIPF